MQKNLGEGGVKKLHRNTFKEFNIYAQKKHLSIKLLFPKSLTDFGAKAFEILFFNLSYNTPAKLLSV